MNWKYSVSTYAWLNATVNARNYLDISDENIVCEIIASTFDITSAENKFIIALHFVW